MKLFSIEEIFTLAKKQSDFYKFHYSSVPNNFENLGRLPIINLKNFWEMNTLKNNHLLTGPIEDAIIFKSGGTTGSPKFSVYTREEWRTFTYFFGQGMAKHAIQPKDKVANLFYAGDLYASFLFIHDSLERSSQTSVNFPISGNIDSKHLSEIINDFSINVLAGVPTTLIGFAKFFEENKIKLPSVNKILYGGESLYPDQKELLKKVFPGTRLQSIGIASVDGGLIGYSDASCSEDEHRCFDDATIVEIIDDFGKVISEPGIPGQMYLTSLSRTLMPIIRYPGGDRAEWTEPTNTPNRKFKILGRSEEGARIGPISIYYDDIYKMLHELGSEIEFHGFQLVTTHENNKDNLIIRIAKPKKGHDLIAKSQIILAKLFEQRPMIKDLLADAMIATPKVEWSDQLEINQRTGKLRRILDLRKGQL